MTNPLLEDIEHEYHNHLLEKGNLLHPKRNAWIDHTPVEDLGYFPRVLVSTCLECEEETKILIGVFHVTKKGSTTHAKAVKSLKGLSLHPPEYEAGPSPSYCLKCLPYFTS